MEGPTKVVIPRREELRCSGCKYYNHRMVRSGFNPIYENSCSHPDVEESDFSFLGNLPKTGITPNWCPYLKKKHEQS